MTFEEKYREYMETIHPDPALLEKTLQIMKAEQKMTAPAEETEQVQEKTPVQPVQTEERKPQTREKKEPKLQVIEGKKKTPPRRSKKNRTRSQWWGYAGVAVAASLLTAVVLTGANKILVKKQDSKSAAAGALMSSAAEEAAESEFFLDAMQETNELEYADIRIYHVEGKKIVGETQHMECSIDKIVDVWAMNNDIHDLTVNVVEFQDEGNAIGIHVDVSGTIIDQLDEEGLKIQALTRTLSEYLNADSVSITADGMLLG